MSNIICHPDGIHTVDSGFGGRPGRSAVHLVVDHGRVAVIDTANNASVPHILTVLARMGIRPDMVDWVILTHLHLDHAGGAGSLMCALPDARLVIHPRGARHMANPARLWEEAVSLYGAEQTFRLYGRLTPVDERRIIPSRDGMELPLGERTLRVLDAPGHAPHHIVVWDERARAFFTGDAFGVSYRELDVGGRAFVFPAISPERFDPDDMIGAIDRMLAHEPEAMYLSRYGRVTGIERLAADLFRLIHAQVAIARVARGDGVVRHVEILAGLEQLVREECARQRWALDEEDSLDLLRTGLGINAQGLGMWLDRIREEEEEKEMAVA
ncbi:MAG: MBL fold metallo-hydrolase [Azoarcus sp.]|jgi:hydroxyacylglutathione hydrolase|nr:MBL fold metallo-hydrolase [Azoarcus sp.]